MTDLPPELDRRKIRIGLAIISLVFVGAVVGFILIDDNIGKAVMAGVALVVGVRVFLLTRSLRRDAATS